VKRLSQLTAITCRGTCRGVWGGEGGSEFDWTVIKGYVTLLLVNLTLCVTCIQDDSKLNDSHGYSSEAEVSNNSDKFREVFILLSSY